MSRPVPSEVRDRSRLDEQPGLLVTGQTTRYASEDDDGFYQVGYTDDNRWHIIDADVLYDSRTGLYWPRDWTDRGWIFGARADWGSAFDAIDTMNGIPFAGHSDWRMPNVNELRTLLDMEVGPVITGVPWISRQSPYPVWSSNTSPLDTTQALAVSLLSGASPRLDKTTVGGPGLVVCRGGPL